MELNFEARTFGNLSSNEQGLHFTETQVFRYLASGGNVRIINGKAFIVPPQDVGLGLPVLNIVCASTLIPRFGWWSSMFPGFRVQSAKLARLGVGGGVDSGMRIDIEWQLVYDDVKEDTSSSNASTGFAPKFPWSKGIEGYSFSPIEVQQSIKKIVVPDIDDGFNKQPQDDQDEVFEVEETKIIPFRSTAGTELLGEVPRIQVGISFSKNVKHDNFFIHDILDYVGRVNEDAVLIKDIEYEKGRLLIKNIKSTETKEYNEDGSLKWEYYVVSFELICDPKTFFINYLNASQFFLSEGGIAQIWTGSDADTRYFGTKEDVFNALVSDTAKQTIEAVSEPMFLTKEGLIQDWNPNTLQLSQKKQTPTFIRGCPHPMKEMQNFFDAILSTND